MGQKRLNLGATPDPGGLNRPGPRRSGALPSTHLLPSLLPLRPSVRPPLCELASRRQIFLLLLPLQRCRSAGGWRRSHELPAEPAQVSDPLPILLVLLLPWVDEFRFGLLLLLLREPPVLGPRSVRRPTPLNLVSIPWASHPRGSSIHLYLSDLATFILGGFLH
jgi:hypothetical protein